MKSFIFYKTEENKWYVDLPNWDGEIADLEMVCGADLLLDIIAQGEDRINVSWIEDKPELFKYSLILQQEEEWSGATYLVEGENLTPFDAWLCDVTKWVFGYFPKTLYVL